MDGAFDANQLVAMDEALSWFEVPVFVLEVTPDPDRTYVMRGVNAAYEQVVGATRADTLGRSIDELVPARLASTLKRNYDLCVTRRETITYEELLDFNGSETWWYTTLKPKLAPDGRVLQIFGLTRDITSQKTTGLALSSELAEVSALNSELRTLTAMAAHDLRGPLGTLESLIELLLEDFLDMGDGKTELLTASLDVITTLRPQIEALLKRALTLSPKSNRVEPIDFGHICADLAALIDPLGHKTITYPEVTVHADPIALQLVLRNLLDNAARYAKSEIAISLDSSDPNGPKFTIADDGPGFDCKGVKKKQGQSGFGLNAVRHMVQTRGGSFSMTPKGTLGGLSAQFSLPIPDKETQSSDHAPV